MTTDTRANGPQDETLAGSVTVVVPAHNAAATIGETLAGLRSQEYAKPFEVIVVDDGSRDETAALARAAGAEVLQTPSQGAAQARNAGALAARGEVIAFLDSDCRPTAAWLQAGVAALGDADFVQGRTLPDPAGNAGRFDRSLTVAHTTGLYESANLFVRRELFERLGGFETWLVPRDGRPLGEDVWFGWKARRAGARMAFCPEALVHHAVFPRGPREYALERARLRYFPIMARRIPELRDVLFYRRWFLSRRSVAFDLAIAAAGVSLATRRRAWLVAAAPYARLAVEDARRPGVREACTVAATELAADAIGLGALLVGSVRARSLLL